jgi:hypothetical protein
MDKTTRPVIRIHNIELDEIVEREMNDEEFAIHQQRVGQFKLEKAEAEEKANAKAAAEAKLAALGLTANDLKALGL